ncbi:MAG: hypothetical protein ACOX5R_08625 [bacterium]
MQREALAPSLQPLLSPIALAITASIQYVLLILSTGYALPVPMTLLSILECLLGLQLLVAWYDRSSCFSLLHIYALSALFIFRYLFLFMDIPGMWGLRAGTEMDALLYFFTYTLGIVCLHPACLHWTRERSDWLSIYVGKRKILFGVLSAILLALIFWLFTSRNISRDGMDWILRTSRPVWHLYLREPLTIGLYRAVYLLTGSFLTPREIISWFSIIAGVWSVFWFLRWVRERFSRNDKILAAFLLFCSSGGMLVLFFGHIEVYPVLIAGFFTCFHFALAYHNNKNKVEWMALSLSVTFLLHLSTGWILPAFLLLPFLKHGLNRSAAVDFLRFCMVFGAVQVLFWLSLLYYGYGGNLTALTARLHHDFHVGPDRAMFLPRQMIFHPWHLNDLLNEYFYLSIPCVILALPALWRLFVSKQKYDFFLFMCAFSYLLYTLLWNPDRGFPEDWDLFSPLVPLMVLFQLSVLLNGNTHAGRNEPDTMYLEILYIVCLGCLPFSLAQVYYHHLTPFFSPQWAP